MSQKYSKYILIRAVKDDSSPAPSVVFMPVHSASDAWENHKNWLALWENKIDIQIFGVLVFKHSGDCLHLSIKPDELLQLAIEDLKFKVESTKEKIKELEQTNDSK